MPRIVEVPSAARAAISSAVTARMSSPATRAAVSGAYTALAQAGFTSRLIRP
ncbi:hypothetical protein OG565_28025 [Streptomyces sp. NBC_00138]|uniref:hypothetical protein n=1 Tax=Streptomyces sp. NBC_00138 TaxID=2903625 RepID=UPI003256733C